MTRTSGQKFRYLENEKSLQDETKSNFQHFRRAIIDVRLEQNLTRMIDIREPDFGTLAVELHFCCRDKK